MTQPPTGPWGPPPQQQPGGWPGQPGGAPWPAPAPVPPKQGGALKWILGAVALLAVIAITAVVAISCSRPGRTNNAGGGGTTGTSSGASDIASANDKGPVGIITEDPSCAPWTPIASTLAGVENNGWRKRDASIPATAWTPDTQTQYEAVGKAMRAAADQTVPLAKMTPHRVMRELYGQFAAYARAYADSIPTYTPKDEFLAQTASTTSDVITYACAAISSGSAAARAPSVSPPPIPSSVGPIGDLSNPPRILANPDPICTNLISILEQLLVDPNFKTWSKGDPTIPASSWSPDQQALTNSVVPLMNSTADALETLVPQASNPVIQDLIQLGVQYRRAYIRALPTYQPNDDNIYTVGQYAPGIVALACKALIS